MATPDPRTSTTRRSGGGRFGGTAVTTTKSNPALPTVSTTAKSSGSSGGGSRSSSGSSSGSGSSGALPKGRSEAYYDWMGSFPSGSMAQKMEDEGWTEDTIRRYAVANGGNGALMVEARNTVRQIAAPFYNGDPSGLPDSLLKTIINSGDYADASYLTNTYFPTLKGCGATNPLAADWVQSWTDATGRPLTYTAQVKLSEIVKTYGFTDAGLAAWEAWVKTTDSAWTGNWGATERAETNNAFASLLGRNATTEELSINSPYINLNKEALQETIMNSPEGLALYKYKPAWQSPEDYIDESIAMGWVLSRWYGDNFTVNDDGSVTIYTGEPDLYNAPTIQTGPAPVPQANPNKTDAGGPAPIWKSLTNAQFASDLSIYGVTVQDGKYLKDGSEITVDQLEAILPKDTYYRDSAGFHYVQEVGAVDKYGKPAAVTKPAATRSEFATTTTAPTTTGFGSNFGIKYGSVVEAIRAADPTMTASQLGQYFDWQNEAEFQAGINDEMMIESFGSTFSNQEWFEMVSGAKGSGAKRAQVQQAANRVAFREAWRNEYGMESDPTPADYDFLTSTYVSPNEFAHRKAALHSAEGKIDGINELLGRTLGTSVTLADLENLAMGGQGSGSIQAMIDQATRLDAFTDILYQYKGGAPTPDDYAEAAGYPSAAAFKWEITVVEQMDEMRDVINETMTKVLGKPMTEEELKIMLGRSEGWGELQAQYNEASKEVDKAESARNTAMNIDKISPIYTAAEQGGFKTGLPGLGDLGGM